MHSTANHNHLALHTQLCKMYCLDTPKSGHLLPIPFLYISVQTCSYMYTHYSMMDLIQPVGYEDPYTHKTLNDCPQHSTYTHIQCTVHITRHFWLTTKFACSWNTQVHLNTKILMYSSQLEVLRSIQHSKQGAGTCIHMSM